MTPPPAARVDGIRTGRDRRLQTVPPDFWKQAGLAQALARRDIGAVFLALQNAGMSQRTIARLTQQSQSEIAQILAGRTVQMNAVVERVAAGLDIPREAMGLADRPAMTATVQASPTPPGPGPRPVGGQRGSTPTGRPAANTGAPPAATPVFIWTGLEVRTLRLAMRMSVRAFAAFIGVSDRMVSKWGAT